MVAGELVLLTWMGLVLVVVGNSPSPGKNVGSPNWDMCWLGDKPLDGVSSPPPPPTEALDGLLSVAGSLLSANPSAG